jgi:hypothetical protein
MGLALALCILVYGLYLFAGKRQADRVDEAIRVKVNESPSRDEVGR